MDNYKLKKDIKFRDYQVECLNKLEEHYENKDKGIICVPTGGGKTIIFSKFSEEKKALIVSHTEELVNQAKSKFEFVSSKNCGIVNANNWENNNNVISGSIQTLYSRIETKEFQTLVLDKEFLIVDEAHHFPAETYIAVYNKILKYNPKIKLLGVTATPFRSDDLELKEYFEDMIYNVNIKKLIQENYLVSTKAKIIRIPENLAIFNKIPIRKDKNGITDYSLKSLSNILGEDKVLTYVLDNFVKEFQNRKTLFFTTSIEVSKEITKRLQERGVNAVHIDGTIPKKERTQIIEDYQNGKIKVLSNVNILTEGFDDPSTECIALLRPTKSLNLYAQIIGRGLRPSPITNKENCLVLDFTPATTKFNKGLANLFELFDLNADSNSKETLEQFTISGKQGGLCVNFGTSSEELELFNNQIHLKDYLVNINESEVLSCAENHHILLTHSKDEFELNKIKIINVLNGEIEEINNIPDNIVMAKMQELWLDIKDNIKASFKEKLSDEEIIPKILKLKKEINLNIFNLKQYDHNHMIIDEESDLKELSRIKQLTYLKYLEYLNDFVYCKETTSKQVVCEDLSINYTNFKFKNLDELLNYYIRNKKSIEFENELIKDFVTYLAPVEDNLWIPEDTFIEHRRKDSFCFKIKVNGEFKLYKVEHNEQKEEEIYKHIIMYIVERIHHIRNNKSNNPKYYRVPTLKYLKRLNYVSKKMNCYKEIKHLFLKKSI